MTSKLATSNYRRLLSGTLAETPKDRQAFWVERGYWTDETVGYLLGRIAAHRPLQLAIIDEDGRHTYAELLARSDAIAMKLLESGIQPGHVVSWVLPNCMDAVALSTAIWRVGAVSNPIVPIYREHELQFILGELRPFAVVASEQLRGRQLAAELDAVLDAIGHEPAVRLAKGAGQSGWVDLGSLTTAARPLPACARGAKRPALALYTSGSTAKPKGVVHNSRSLLCEIRQMQSEWALSRNDRFYMASPLTHIAGTLQGMLLPLYLGATAIFQVAWDPATAVDRIETEKATYMVGATVFLQNLVEEYERRGTRSALHQFTCGGASVPPSLIEAAQEIGITAYRVWGMTEFPTTTMNNTQAPLQHRSNTDGHVADGVEVQAVSSQHQMVPWGQPGELRVRGPERMIGYVDPGLNSEVCDADGWLYTGDVGYVDASRDVVITGRIKDIINRGGEKFAARDIEDALSTHPAVAEVAVIGIPGGRLGERVCAVAVLRPGMKPTPADLVSYLDACRIAKQKIPEEIRFVDRLPRTAFGKIQKFKIIDDW